VLTNVKKLIEAAEKAPSTYPLSSLPGGRRITGRIPLGNENNDGTINLHINNYSVSYRDVHGRPVRSGSPTPNGDGNNDLES